MHNEIVRRRPDLARVLAGPWFMDRKGEVPEGKKGYFELPVFNYHQVGLAHFPITPGLYWLVRWLDCPSHALCLDFVGFQ